MTPLTAACPFSQSDFIPEAGRNTKASLCLLKLCNALLRRLSKTHNSVFCGKILVFLSFTFALSERSAVNLMGKVCACVCVVRIGALAIPPC